MSTYHHDARTRRVLRALVPVICPPEAVPLADAIVDHLGLTLAASPAPVRLGLVAGLRVYDLGALPRYRRRAHALAPADAEAYFASWEHGPTPFHVQLARGINQLMSLSCYEQPAMTEAVGYRPAPFIEEVTRRRLTVYADEIRAQATRLVAPDPLRPAPAAEEVA